MASLDVLDAFDPSFMDSGLMRIRLTQTVDTNGIASNAAVTTAFAAVVVPKEGANLVRLPDGSQVHETISVYAPRFDLQSQSAGLSADIVTWRGAQYTVKGVDGYAHFGAGFVNATCELIPLSGG